MDSEHITHQGKTIEVVQKEVSRKGVSTTLEFARRSPGVRVIISKGEKVLLTKEFRHELNGYDYRLPGGKVYDTLAEYNAALDTKTDIAEAAKKAAIKEAREEAGVEIKNISFAHKSICGGSIKWDLYYFVAKEFEEVGQALETGEDITVEWVDKEKARRMCLEGGMAEERSALVLLRFLEGALL